MARWSRLKDIARIELGASEYALRSLLDNKSAVAIGIFQAPGSNAIAISDNVRKAMAEMKNNMPEGVDYAIVYDPTQFVRASIEAVIHTLLEAVALVVLVVILFLQTWRASIIPLLAVPVSIIGTFAVLYMLGLSINALSLFGLVLAIGIVVDDAIVVVENVERNIEEGLSPREATYQRDDAKCPGPIIAIALVLCRGVRAARLHQRSDRPVLQAVRADHRDLDGDLGDQLADPVAGACRRCCSSGHDAPKDWLTRMMDFAFGWLFRGFNHVFRRGSEAYARGVRARMSRKAIMMGVYVVLVGLTVVVFRQVPRRLRAGAGQAISRRLLRSCRTAPRWTVPKR